MFSWILENLGTIVVSVIVLAVVVLILYKGIRNKKKGKFSCSSGCANCPMNGKCH